MELMNYKIDIVLLSLLLWLNSCTEPFVPDTDANQPIVVEGYVEAGPGSIPAYVIVTKALPFITEIGPDQLGDLFVNNADVKVSDGDKTVQLTELCLDELPDDLKAIVAESLNLDVDSLELNICAYIDLLDELTREEERSYNLRIETDGKVLTATTTIPKYVPLYDFRFDQPPGEPSDQFARLFTTIDDPEEEVNFYRYKSAEEDGPLITPFSSVVNDVFYNGQTFEFPLSKAEDLREEVPFDEFGLFQRGDSITIKWMAIDEAHFDFWNTRDFSANSAGPFSSYTRIDGNVEGALGIWGGYSVDNYRLFVPFQ